MGQFKAGDRVEVIDDIGNHYLSHVGIVTNARQREMAVAEEVDVCLANGLTHRFFDFQLRTRPAASAHIVFDSTVAPQPHGIRGSGISRHLQFAAEGFVLHIQILEQQRAVHGQVVSIQNVSEPPLVTLLVDNEPQQTTGSDDFGDFRFEELPDGKIAVEIFLPGRRFVADLSI
jgi:hypothetical protein